MKSILTLLLAALIVQFSFAQEQEPEEKLGTDKGFRTLNNSVGFGVVGGGELRNQTYIMPALGYKRFVKDGAIRVLVGGNVNTNSSSNGVSTSTGNETAFNARIGYQYHVLLGRFMPTIGCDIAGGYYEVKNKNSMYKNSESVMMGGLSPNVGLEFWISKKLSACIDLRFDISYREHAFSYEYLEWNGTWTTNSSTTTGINTHVSPISSFMLAFHF